MKFVFKEYKEIKSLKTPISLIKNNGLAIISISEVIGCKHNFLVVIGRDFMQRSSYIPDFNLEIST